MKLSRPDADIFTPDGSDPAKALARTTHLCVTAHQDDIEINAYPGIAECYGKADRFFTGVTVTNGLFITAIDFGDTPKSFAPVWLEIAVRTNGGMGGFAILSPRQQIMPVPFSFYALTASNLSGVLPAAPSTAQASSAVNESTGAISLSKLCVMCKSAVCAERRARLRGAEV